MWRTPDRDGVRHRQRAKRFGNQVVTGKRARLFISGRSNWLLNAAAHAEQRDQFIRVEARTWSERQG